MEDYTVHYRNKYSVRSLFKTPKVAIVPLAVSHGRLAERTDPQVP